MTLSAEPKEKYAPGIDAPASIGEVAADIAGQCGFEIDYDFFAVCAYTDTVVRRLHLPPDDRIYSRSHGKKRPF